MKRRSLPKRYRLSVYAAWLSNWAPVARSASKAYLQALGDELASKNRDLQYMLDVDGGDRTVATWNE